jgi:hypothetical protein
MIVLTVDITPPKEVIAEEVMDPVLAVLVGSIT